MQNDLVSVVIPNYNYAQYLQQSIESVLNQDYEPIEVVVVDDGSTDESREILRSFGTRIKVIEITNSGAPTARNFGLMNTRGKYIAYLDSDDYWMTNKISTQVQRLLETRTDLVYCGMRILEVDSDLNSISTENREGSFRKVFLQHPVSTPFPPSTVLMTRNLVSRAGIWDTTFQGPAEDFDYFRRCAKYTDFSVVREVQVVHRNHSKSLTTQSLEKYYADNCLSLVKLFADEYPRLNFFDRRISWVKLNSSYAKEFLKSGRLMMSLRCLIECCFPIRL
jgi:glycosyltransferase involved in cell wall biosynthesis